ncbi:MAG: CHAT domain-containing protein [Limnospira sp. PMC 1238.20]|uniref:CHAT domain-containing tetratricopeptide repeat protein n=1 Tax=unclassified Limnospira TaxID=2642885 RepID=UPI0028E0E162|nr:MULTISPECIES: CHAT domain-containing tetratricopeptide repeat protein [unclassified Limnospira]MDT9177720.1 CHAT domain-containing protein [Limnospira sp. PMC 1238.20]MDT9228998.1 CHAT domain-containing protein [Limnospira sp. PMC 1242.20]
MDKQRVQAYLPLMQELLTCPIGEELAILSKHRELVDEGLVQVMRDVAEKMAEQGDRNAGSLRDFADTIEAVNYELPLLQKLKADDLLQQGFQSYQRSQFHQAILLWQHCLELYRQIGDISGEIKAVASLGNASRRLGQVQRAIEFYEQCLTIAREIGDRVEEGKALGSLGNAYRQLGQVQKAIEFYKQDLAIAREVGDRAGEGMALGNLGTAYSDLGQVQQAIPLYQQDLDIAREMGNRVGETVALGNLGAAYSDLGQMEEAIYFYEQHLGMARAVGYRFEEARALKGLENAFRELGQVQVQKSIEFDKPKLDITITRAVSDRIEEGNTLTNLAIGYYKLGEFERAIECYEQDLAIAREVGNRLREGSTLGNLGLVYWALGQFQQAIDLSEQHLQIAQEVGDRIGEGNALGNLGLAYSSLGQFQRAIDYHRQALAIAREVGDRSGEGRHLGNLGLAQYRLGQMEQAINLYEQWLAIAREVRDLAQEGHALGNIGGVYHVLGQVQLAIESYNQWLGIARSVGDRVQEGRALGGLGLAYHDLGEMKRATEYHKQGLAIAQEVGDRGGEGSALVNLGNAYYSLGQVEQAIKYYEQSLAIAREVGDRAGEGLTLGSLGNAYYSLGQVEQAIKCYEQSLAIAREVGDRAGEGLTLGSLGNAYYSLGQVEQAIKCYEQSLAIAREVGYKAKESWALGNLGVVYQHLNRIPEAIAAWKEGLTICPPEQFPLEALDIGRRLGDAAFEIEDWETAIYGYEAAIEAVETRCTFTDSYTEKQKRREAALDLYPQLVQACINAQDIGKALASVERSKSRNLIELLSNRDLYPKGDIPPEILRQLDKLRREVTAKQRLIETLDRPTNPDNQDIGGLGQRGSSAASFTPEVMKSLRQEYEQAQKDLTRLLETINTYDPNFSLTQRVPHIQFSQIQELLDKETLLMQWYLSPQGIYTFIVSGETGEISVHLSPPENLEQLQELRDTYLQTYQRHHSDDWETNLDHFLRRLRDILELPQLLPQIPPTYRRLIVVPYRELHLFPLHALPLGDDDEPDYLADRFPLGVTYSPSCQFLEVSQRQRKTSNRQRFFAIQNPTEDLDYADLEVDAILANFSTNASRLTRQQASKTSLKENPHRQAFQEADYLHFAGHGAFNFNSPLLSPLVLAGAKISVSDSEGRTLCEETTPSEPAETRFLPWRKGTQIDLSKCYTLGELFELDLPACRLVILSACETGLTDFSPNLEEYISLGLGFLYAGAANVICSLWAVNDVSTAILMVKLYEEMQTQPSVALALKQAQEWMRAVTKQELTAWLNEQDSAGNRYPKAKLRDNLALGFKRADYRPYQHPIHWGAFCAIGV